MKPNHINITIHLILCLAILAFSCNVDEPKPNGTFTYELAQEYSPVSVSFNASLDYGGINYHWDFGDGTTGDGITITHKYTDKGTYQVTLETEGVGGITTRQEIIDIPDRPTSVQIEKVTLSKWPLLNNGIKWDFQLTEKNDNPDIWYTIDINNTGNYHDAPFQINDVEEDKEAVWISAENNDTIILAFDKKSIIYFYDFDGDSPNELILSDTITPNDHLDFPKFKTFEVRDSTDLIGIYTLRLKWLK